jgi:iron complex outermembrane receptor protein
MKRAVFLGASAIALSAVHGMAHAQSEEQVQTGSGAEEGTIIVTAQKRAQNLQDVPLAISAFNGETLREQGATTTQDVAALVPGLSIPNESPSGATNAFIFMRGIGTDNTQYTLDPAVGIYLDGVYLARAYGTSFDLVDVERVEVLRGPQGTLYGRNSSAGAIRVISKAPVLRGLDVVASVGYGRFNELRGDATVSAPIIEDKLGVRITASHRENDGFQVNALNRSDRAQSVNFSSINASVLFAPTEDVSVTLRYNDFRDRGDAIQNEDINDTTPRVFESNLQNLNRVGNRGISGTLEWDIAPDVKLTAISAFRWVSLDAAFNLDGTALPEFEVPFQQIRSEYATQEIFFSGSRLGGLSLDWAAGGFYYDEKIKEAARVEFGPDVLFPGQPPLAIPSDRRFDAEAYSLFAEGTLNVTPGLGLTAGVRWTQDKKSFSDAGVGLAQRNFKDDNVTWRLGADFQPVDNVLLYGSVTTGFRSGGFDINTGNPFPTEKVTNYEGGVKLDILDRLLTVNAAYFYADYQSLQQSVTDPTSPTGLATVFFDATTQGLELEVTVRPVGGLVINGNLATLATDPDVPNPAARDLKQSPEFTGRIAASYEFPVGNSGSFMISGDYVHTSSYFLDPDNTPFRKVEPSDIVNARAAFTTADRNWEFAVTGRNLTGEDAVPFIFAFGFNGLSVPVTRFNRTPRTWLVSATYRY